MLFQAYDSRISTRLRCRLDLSLYGHLDPEHWNERLYYSWSISTANVLYCTPSDCIGASGVKGKALGYPTASPAVKGASNLEESTFTTQSLAAKVSQVPPRHFIPPRLRDQRRHMSFRSWLHWLWASSNVVSYPFTAVSSVRA